MEVKLIVLEGKNKDREIPLPETIFLIGRDRQCHLRPHCQLVSKLHCAIAAWAGKVRVRDLKSRNGTFLNGQPIQGEVVAEDGDRLQVGTLVFSFRIPTAAEGPIAWPIGDECDLEWLLGSPADSDVLSTGTDTMHVQADAADGPYSNSGTPDPATVPGSKAVSAGQHLRTYLERRKGR